MDWNHVVDVIVPIAATQGLRIIGALVFFWVAMRISNVAQQRITRGLRARDFDTTLSLFFGNVVRWLVLLISILSILGIFGVETSSFAALLGAIGLATGLAFQGTLSNFAAGVMLLVFRPFKVGDRIVIGEHRGVVSEIGIFATALDTTDKRRKVLPNSTVNSAAIENHSFHEVRRVDVVCYFAAECPPARIRAMLDPIGAKWTPPGARPHEIVVKHLHPYGSEWELRIFAPMREHNDVLYGAQEEVLQGTVDSGLQAPGTCAPRLTSS